MAKSYLARPSFKIGNMNLMDSRLLSQVDLSPAPLLSEHSDSFTKLRTHIGGHSSSISLVEALYLVDALSALNLGMLNSNAPSGSTGLDTSGLTAPAAEGIFLLRKFDEFLKREHFMPGHCDMRRGTEKQ